eukprot:g3187.t1
MAAVRACSCIIFAAFLGSASAAAGQYSFSFRGTSTFLADELPQLLARRPLSAGLSVHVSVSVAGNSSAGDRYDTDVWNTDGGVRVNVTSPTAIGASHGAFAMLGSLGYGFLHPMRVVAPSRPCGKAELIALRALNGTRHAPRLATRTSHVHAEHPNELCNVLNGFDAGGGHADAAEWAALLPEVRSYLRWLVAHGQNAVEWSLLSAKAYPLFAESAERRRRLRVLAAEARRYGLAVGIDATFSQWQEHGFRLWRTPHAAEQDDWAEIRARLDWLVADAGFDYVHSELGRSELTEGAPNTTRLMALLNRTAQYLGGLRPPRAFMVENHITGGQTVDLPDPLHPGRRLNFNWLTYYLDRDIVSRPHTVQAYSLADPAPTYGAANFSATLDFIGLMLGAGRRVVYYPESAYWCNYDISVPLFLAPLYSLSRVTDLQLIARRERAAAAAAAATVPPRAARPLQGQALFESGWQWGYWLNNLVAMRAQWVLDTADGAGALAALRASLQHVLAPLALAGGTAGGGGGAVPAPAVASLVGALVVSAQHQHALLVLGNASAGAGTGAGADAGAGAGAGAPARAAGLAQRTGISLLQGVDAMADLFQGLGAGGLGVANITSQPDRLSLRALARHEPKATALYAGGVAALLREMANVFRADAGALATAAAALLPPGAAANSSASALRDTLADLTDAAELLAQRARQLDALYELAHRCGPGAAAGSGAGTSGASTTGRTTTSTTGGTTGGTTGSRPCAALVRESRAALAAAQARVGPAEARYGLAARGSARLWAYGRNANPTAYGFGHLWQVHGLYYWRRDQRIAENAVGLAAGGRGTEPGTEVSPASPCFANVRNPLDIYEGDGTGPVVAAALRWLEKVADAGSGVVARVWGNISACLVQEPLPPLAPNASASYA